jgi:hypothetical protein
MLSLREELIASLVCSITAVLVTLGRLYIRRGRMWWDDAFALFSMIFLLVQVIGLVLHVQDIKKVSQLTLVAGYYIMATNFYAIIWTARLSILFSVIRIDPWEKRRRRLLLIAILFLVAFVILLIQLFWVCEPDPAWKRLSNPQCPLSIQVAIFQLVTDVIADSLLLAAPLRLLQGLEDKPLRRRLIFIFSTCIVTTIVSLVHAVYIFKHGGPKVLIAAFVENCVSLIVCSVPVVVTASMRLRSFDVDESSIPANRGPTFLKFASGPSKTQRTTYGGTKFSTVILSDMGSSSQTAESSTLSRFEETETETPKTHFHDEETDLVVQDIHRRS